MADDYLSIFGWKFKKPKESHDIKAPIISPTNDDAAFAIGTSGYGFNVHKLNLDQVFQSDNELIRKYRDIATQPEPDQAITEIVNEAICGSDDGSPVNIVLDKLKESDKIKNMIRTEFDTVTQLLKFNKESYEIFRKWYVDGRLYYHMIIDPLNPKNGITELRHISPLCIKKVREEEMATGPGGIEYVKSYEEYYMYSKEYVKSPTNGIKVTADSICYVNSGLIEEQINMVYSWLHKAIKPTNQLRMMEDAVVIYRLSRAPERRIFYVDVGNLPTKKAEEYLKNIMARYKNKIVYDVVSGEVKDSAQQLSMMEDFWIPRRDGNRGTEIDTLKGGENLGDIEDIEYFKRKLYQSLNVPIGRISTDQNQGMFNTGSAGEITRDEVKFSKFISRLRKRFSHLFLSLLRTQLLLKQIITEDEWLEIKELISFDFISDTHYEEMKNIELLRVRTEALNSIREYVGVYFSKEHVCKTILQMTDDDMELMEKQMKEEKKQDAEASPLTSLNNLGLDMNIDGDLSGDFRGDSSALGSVAPGGSSKVDKPKPKTPTKKPKKT